MSNTHHALHYLPLSTNADNRQTRGLAIAYTVVLVVLLTLAILAATIGITEGSVAVALLAPTPFLAGTVWFVVLFIRLGRAATWLAGTALFDREVFATKRVDLATAHVWLESRALPIAGAGCRLGSLGSSSAACHSCCPAATSAPA
ncbi:MAG: hypothetical protein GEV07_12840 [Streptosporangiales bacterium]|nr:hypothetical protein [Streptosporangiales bacterium]